MKQIRKKYMTVIVVPVRSDVEDDDDIMFTVCCDKRVEVKILIYKILKKMVIKKVY